jgi:extracellular matrix regulatory protein A
VVRLVNIGYGNAVVAERVVAIISPDSAPMKRFKEEARKAGRLIDGTQGRRTRSILIVDSHHVVLSALATETVAERLERGVQDDGSDASAANSTSGALGRSVRAQAD